MIGNFIFMFANLEPPGPPINIQVQTRTETSCVLTWDSPVGYDNANVYYHIEMKSEISKYNC